MNYQEDNPNDGIACAFNVWRNPRTIIQVNGTNTDKKEKERKEMEKRQIYHRKFMNDDSLTLHISSNPDEYYPYIMLLFNLNRISGVTSK